MCFFLLIRDSNNNSTLFSYFLLVYSVYSLIQLNVQFHAHWVTNQTQLVMVVFQSTYASPRIPVRMEQRVILVLTATLTTPAHVLELLLEKIVQV